MKDGITLIALVITIIVLIILAMVTIAMLTGPNGLLNKAVEAQIANDKAEIQDRAETEVLGSIGDNGKINWGDLKKNLKSNFGDEAGDIANKETDDASKGLTFTVEKNSRSYEVDIDEEGKVTVTEEGETSGGESSSSSEPSKEPSIEPSEEAVQMLNPGDTASKTQKDNYEDTSSNKKATIPQGFTVSSEDHEIDTGLVVEAPDGSEFVWVPVEKAIAESEETAITANEADGTTNKAMAVKDPDNTNYRGILYDFPSSTTDSKVMNGSTTNDGTSSPFNREPAYLKDSSSGDGASWNAGRVTEDGLKSEYKEMIESVDQYGGFYVGRYETSLSGSKAQSKKGQTSMDSTTGSGNRWWGMYEKEKKYASDANISSVGSSMIWGSQYDAMLNWILKGSEASKVREKITQHSKTTTGSTSGDIINKIYDLGNNLSEWTLEASMVASRTRRGGSYNDIQAPYNRNMSTPGYIDDDTGSRLALYII